MMLLGLTLYEDSTKAVMIGNWSARVDDLFYETAENRGFGYMAFHVELEPEEVFLLWDRINRIAHVVLSDGAFVAFEGRLEDRALAEEGGLDLVAYGYIRALADTEWRRVFSIKHDYWSNWVPTNEEDGASPTRVPSMYQMNKDKQLFVGLIRNQTYTNNADFCGWHLELPTGIYDEDVTYVVFDWECRLPTNWYFHIYVNTRDYSALDYTLLATGNGSVQSGTSAVQTVSGADRYIVEFPCRNASGSTYTCTQDNGYYYTKVTNVRIMSSDAYTALYGDEIVKDAVAFVYSINPTQISDDVSLVEGPGVDLEDAVFLDKLPLDVIDYVAKYGDDSTPAQTYEYGIYEDQTLFFRPRESGANSWYINDAKLRANAALDTVWNSAYGTYNSPQDPTPRITTISDDSDSITLYGITRRRAVKTPAGSSTAADLRDAVLQDNKDIVLKAKVEVDSVFTDNNVPVPLYMVRAMDTATMRHLPVGYTFSESLRVFYIRRTRFYPFSGRLIITPGYDPPSLEDLVSLNAAGREEQEPFVIR